MSEKAFSSAKSNEKLHYGFTAPEVIEFIRTLRIKPSDNLKYPNTISTINVGISQVAMRPYNSLPDYVREMNYLVTQAADQRAHIVVFPAYTGLLPCSLFPQYDKVLSHLQIDPITGFPQSLWINQAISAVASECFEVYFSTMSALAAAHQIYVMAGSTIYPEKGKFYHRAFLFDPNGKLVGTQDKLIAGPLEHSLFIDNGGEIKKFHTLLGDLSILIGSDVNYFETTYIAHSLGSQIILNPTAFLSKYNGVIAAEGLNLRVQERPFYGVQSTLIGKTPFGITLEGPSGVFAPLKFSLPNAKNSMYLRTIKHYQTQLLSARLSPEDLENIQEPLRNNRNSQFLKKYIDLLY